MQHNRDSDLIITNQNITYSIFNYHKLTSMKKICTTLSFALLFAACNKTQNGNNLPVQEDNDYTISTTDKEMTGFDTAYINVYVDKTNDNSNPTEVSLSIKDIPNNTIATFEPNGMLPPFTSVLTIITNNAKPNKYKPKVIGTTQGTRPKEYYMYLDIKPLSESACEKMIYDAAIKASDNKISFINGDISFKSIQLDNSLYSSPVSPVNVEVDCDAGIVSFHSRIIPVEYIPQKFVHYHVAGAGVIDYKNNTFEFTYTSIQVGTTDTNTYTIKQSMKF